MTGMTTQATMGTDRDPCATALDLCPELADLLSALASIDQLTAKAVAMIRRLQDTGEVETATGLPLELWLSARGRRTRSDRRMLTTAADTLVRLPNIADAFRAGQLSWAQARAIVLVCERLPGQLCGHIDLELSRRMLELEQADPDDAVHLVRQAAASYSGEVAGPDQPAPLDPDDRFVHIQPRLDGTGGRVYGELDAVGLTVFDRATDPGPQTPDQRGRTVAGRRADRLIDTLADSLAGQPGRDTARQDAADPSAGGTGSPAPADARDAGESAPASHRGRRGGGDGALLPVAPSLLLTTTLDSLLGRDSTPAELLVSLAGGRLKVSAELARRLVNQGGAAIRLLVLDDTGTVVGIGRKTPVPPEWLDDATLATDRTCAQPGCDRPAIHCDTDHIHDWDHGGRTDLPNLQRLCRHHNRTTRKTGWDITIHPNGDRTWTHQRSGLTVRTTPATRRLPPPRGQPPDDPEPPGDPPGWQRRPGPSG